MTGAAEREPERWRVLGLFSKPSAVRAILSFDGAQLEQQELCLGGWERTGQVQEGVLPEARSMGLWVTTA